MSLDMRPTSIVRGQRGVNLDLDTSANKWTATHSVADPFGKGIVGVGIACCERVFDLIVGVEVQQNASRSLRVGGLVTDESV